MKRVSGLLKVVLRSKASLIDGLALLFVCVFFLPVIFFAALVSKVVRVFKDNTSLPRLVWAGPPLLSMATASAAMQTAGYKSETFANSHYNTADDSDFDHCLAVHYRLPYGLNTIVYTTRASIEFCKIMFLADILHSFFSGGILGRTPLAFLEFRLWKLSGGRLVLMPYGSDSFIYHKLPDTEWASALKQSYPRTVKQDLKVEQRVYAGSRYADAIVGCIVHDVCLPRIDFFPVLWYPFDPKIRPEYPSGTVPIRIAHAANHRIIKGTNAIEEVVSRLKSEGHLIEFIVLTNRSHADVLTAFRSADIIIDQILFGYALAALEAMALGKVVITGVDNSELYDNLRHRGLLDNLPLLFSNPSNLYNTLLQLIENPDVLITIGQNTREFVENRHGFKGTIELFEAVYWKICNIY